MTGLLPILLRRIEAEGPISLASYMRECLLHPEHGYYTTRLPFGGEGDFVTAPEISQMYGELLGLALAQSWRDQGAPSRFTLAEYGPGRGTLMADVLRAARHVPGFLAAAEIVLLEASPRLRALQKAALAPHTPRWILRPEDLPDQPLFLLANEFFDALPIHQFERNLQGWRERQVGIGEGRLCFGWSKALPPDLFDPRFAGDVPDTLVELRPAAEAPVQTAAARIRRHGGLALIADYGSWRSKGDTFQALQSHRFADPLAAPGEADLTAHVDFEALVRGTGLAHRYGEQGAVLMALGIEARAKALLARLTGVALDNHFAALRRLTAPEEMGEVFKMLALYPVDAPPPPGFA